jgi:hypothetical protein
MQLMAILFKPLLAIEAHNKGAGAKDAQGGA